jgi:hypothetical protein
LAAAVDAGRSFSIAVGSTGSPHISFFDSTNKSLNYAKKERGVWTRETVFDDGDVGRWNSIALDQLRRQLVTVTITSVRLISTASQEPSVANMWFNFWVGNNQLRFPASGTVDVPLAPPGHTIQLPRRFGVVFDPGDYHTPHIAYYRTSYAEDTISIGPGLFNASKKPVANALKVAATCVDENHTVTETIPAAESPTGKPLRIEFTRILSIADWYGPSNEFGEGTHTVTSRTLGEVTCEVTYRISVLPLLTLTP